MDNSGGNTRAGRRVLKNYTRWIPAALVGAAAIGTSAMAFADTWTGAGSDNNWMTAVNWGGTQPTPLDSLIFAGTTRLTPTNNFPTDTAFTNLTFNAGAGAFTLSGNAISLVGNVTNNATNAQTINVPLVLAAGGHTFTGGSNLTVSSVISSSGGVVVAGATGNGTTGGGMVTLSGTNTYAGGTTILSGTLRIGNASALGTTPTVTLNGTLDATLDLNGFNTTIGTLNGTFSGSVTDNSASSGVTTLTINGGTTSTYAGSIYDGFSHQVALDVTSNSTVALTGINSYSGGTTIDSGIVQINSAQSLGSTGGLVTINAGTLEMIAAAGTFFEYHSLQLGTATSTVQVDSGATCFFYGTISDFTGPGTLNKTGAGMLILNSTNYYSGGTVVAAGTLQLGEGATLGTNSSPLTLVSGATLDLQGNSATTGALSGTGGTITSSVSGAVTLTTGDASNTTFTGLVQNGSGTLSFVYAGTGSLKLGHPNTYTGTTSITSGTLILTSATSLGTGPVSINGGTLDLSGDPTTNDVAFGTRAVTIAGMGGDGISGAIVNNGTLTQIDAFQNVILSANASIGGTARFDVRGSSATLTLNNHTLTKTGSNQVSIVGTTISDGNIVVNGGTLSLETSTSVHDYADGNTITYLSNTTAQFYESSGDISRPMVFNGTNILVGNADANVTATVASNMTLDSDITFAPVSGASGNLTLNGKISESGGSHGITKNSGGILTLNGVSSFTGNTTLTAGTTVVSASGALASGAISVSAGAIFTVQAGGAIASSTALTANGTVNLSTGSRTIGSLNGSGSLLLNGAALTVASGGSFAGTISNGTATGSLAVSGGVLSLSGANTYSGGTTISGGALYVNSANGTGTGNVALNGGTLGGSGSVGAVFSGVGTQTISPGSAGVNSVGTLTATSLSTTANTTLLFDLGTPGVAGSSDLLKVSGTLSLGGGQVAIASQASTGAASLGYYEVLSYGTVSGSVSGITLPAIANNIEYTLDANHNAGFIDIHRGYIGDANDDGSVDANDLNLVLNNLGTANTSWTAGNFDGAATIDLTDLNDVLNNLGKGIAAGASVSASNAPEPATLVILGMAGVSLALRRRR
jgi:fibronectin-binding autotransporter adhesin